MTRVAIIGGGLAGTACAYVLRRRGYAPEIYEAGKTLASGASGNALGLYNPRLSAQRSPESDYYAAAYALALRTFSSFGAIDWNPCGALHLMTDEKRCKRFAQTAQNWGWETAHMRLVPAEEASSIAGIRVMHDALYLPDSGTVNPKKLCSMYAQNIPVYLNAPVKTIAELDAGVVILACGMGAGNFPETKDLPLRPVRGQVTYAEAAENTQNLSCCLCYGGYCAPQQNGAHMVGSTFKRWLDHSDIVEEDDADNLEKLAAVVPDVAQQMTVTGHRAAVRTTVPDHLPVVGRVPGYNNLYVSLAHGSHGIVSSLMTAHLIADMIAGGPLCLPKETARLIAPDRFFKIRKFSHS